MTIDDESQWAGGPGKPPFEHRWKKGQSGNPAGRKPVPKRPRPMGEIALEHLRMPVKVSLPGRKKKTKVPVGDAIMINAANRAATTDSIHQANRFLKNMVDLGFNYAFEQRSAGIEDRQQLEEVIEAQARVIGTLHETVCALQKQIGRLEKKLGKGGDEDPDPGVEVA